MASLKYRRAIAWNPASPAALWLPPTETATSTSSSSMGILQMNTLLSHNGLGCNPHEVTALMDILDAQDAYMSNARFNQSDWEAHKSLSTAYRKALHDCLTAWDAENDDMTSPSSSSEEGQESLMLFKLVYAVIHLSETFLLVPPSDPTRDFYKNTWYMAGAVTADTIRFLRLHYMKDPYTIASQQQMDALLDSLHPDQFDDDGQLYWKLVETFIIRGCLEDAWALLSRHSIFQRCVSMEEQGQAADSLMDEYHAAILAEDRQGFLELRALLLSAPLPGGRSEKGDPGFDSADDNDAYDNDSDEDKDSNVDDGELTSDEELLDGIPPSLYRLWETVPANRQFGDLPSTYHPEAAKQAHTKWSDYAKKLDGVNKLKRRIPQLQKIIDILCGNFTGVQFETWQEAFCAELLYARPFLKPDDMYKRTSKIMIFFGESIDEGFNEIILSIMKYNAGRVVEVMHDLGGGSGAALPAAMTSLLFNLLIDAEAIPMTDEVTLRKNELLLNASFSIRSSLVVEGNPDLAARLATRILIPHATPENDIQLTATIANILEHHTPETDPATRTLLQICKPLVERKSIIILDGCVSLIVARYDHYMRDLQPGAAVRWIVEGLDLESIILCQSSDRRTWIQNLVSSVCYRMLVKCCIEKTQTLLKGLIGDGSSIPLVFTHACEMVSAVEGSNLASLIPEVKCLTHIVEMARAIRDKQDDSIVVNHIVACLIEKTNNEDDGAVTSIARSSLHWDLLRLAYAFLDRAEEQFEKNSRNITASFDVRGMQVLMERFTVILASRELEKLEPFDQEEIYAMRLAFENGLMAAFMAENAKKKQSVDDPFESTKLSNVYAADLDKYKIEDQERIVSMMLDL